MTSLRVAEEEYANRVPSSGGTCGGVAGLGEAILLDRPCPLWTDHRGTWNIGLTTGCSRRCVAMSPLGFWLYVPSCPCMGWSQVVAELRSTSVDLELACATFNMCDCGVDLERRL